MLKKSMCGALLTVLCCLPVVVNATTCRSGQAATQGSQAGYAQAKLAADSWADRERTVSDQLQACLSRIRTTSISLPSFPSLQDIMNQVADKVCQAAVNQINSNIPSSIDPWQKYQ
ncbi:MULTISPECIES: conjugal transfer protein [unclassified Pseudomonas]|uniref:conjugal transfer protein n=1 Tax=unclassified Pseudomonas TaxID=196821 RepID=UPI002AB4E62C|nr:MULTISPECIES: conjugal transfer protein [unclassified Pseudomonas]MDY7563416.1 conjugal transfer protein [Pseudomonas sp. AB6]MEA9979854.1 conjugal transfer protein [Pseudomonas sp. RTS4]MEA9996486.1 conjugal transfer protein [Pseudomonas sp. AA4]MEB0198156.1 conjugal transfer protein [Pseudomonas sp. 5S4]MEB0213355.1 conjugal transfer protein [Pseudomonas sp. AB6]